MIKRILLAVNDNAPKKWKRASDFIFFLFAEAHRGMKNILAGE